MLLVELDEEPEEVPEPLPDFVDPDDPEPEPEPPGCSSPPTSGSGSLVVVGGAVDVLVGLPGEVVGVVAGFGER